jgi:hypothetical protein
VSVALVIKHVKHMLYCHLWPACLYRIFPRYLINGTICGGGGGKLLNIMCVVLFSTTSL